MNDNTTRTIQLFMSRQLAKWIRRFKRFCEASELATKSEECQVNTLIYTMRDKADNSRGHCDPISDTMYKLRVLIKVPYDNTTIAAYHYYNYVILHHSYISVSTHYTECQSGFAQGVV